MGGHKHRNTGAYKQFDEASSGVRKPFDKELYEKNNEPAIAAVLHHLHQSGLYAAQSDDLYGPDITVFGRGYKKISYIEVEVKHNWRVEREDFPFDTVQLPERKGKFLRKALPIEFWILRPDLRMAVIIPDYTVVSSRLVEVANRLVEAGEKFYQIPLEECHVIELEV